MSVGLEQGELMNQLQNLERICGQVEPEDQDGFRRRIKDGVKKMDRSFAKTGSIFRCKKYSFFKGKRNSLLIMYLPFFGVNHFLLKNLLGFINALRSRDSRDIEETTVLHQFIFPATLKII